MAKWRTQEITQKVVSADTGELIEATTSKSWVCKEAKEPFFLTYVSQISWMYEITSLSDIKVLYKMLESSVFNQGTCFITTDMRKQWASSLNISQVTISKSIKSLTNLNIISGKQGTYTINPEIFWKGDSKTREALLKAGCKITIEPVFESTEF